MTRIAPVFFAAIFACMGSLFAQTSEAPLVNFEFGEISNGVIKDLSGNASLSPGPKASIVTNGPLDLKALKFDGTINGTAKLELGKAKDKLDGFELSLSYWVRFDAFQKADGEMTGSDTGLGVVMNADRKFSFSLPIVGPSQLALPGVTALELGKWHHIGFTYSIDKEEAKLYLDGELLQASTGNELFPLKINWTEIGKFNGAIASLKMWDRVLTEEEISVLKLDEDSLKDFRNKLSSLDTARSPELIAFRDRLAAEIKNLKGASVSLKTVNALAKRINIALKLKPAAEALADTELGKAPFALISVQATSPEIRTPESFPPDPEYTTKLRVAAAKGEFEPVSFIIHPYKDIEKFELIPGEFKGEAGSIPADILDIKVVKCWYQANWNSYFNSSNQILVPDLLLNDETLVKVDEVKRKNYLRIDYPAGPKYCDVNFGGSFENVKPFNFCLEPVRDGKKFASAKLIPGRGTQFWLTVHVPKDAKPGLYTSKIKTVCDGAATGEVSLTLRVFPFELPVAKTSYDLKEEYLTYIIGDASLESYSKLAKRADEAERIYKKDLKNLMDHNMIHAGGPALADGDLSEEIFTRDIQLRKEAGFPLKPLLSIGAADDFGYYLFAVSKGKETPEKNKESMDGFKKKIDRSIALCEKLLGHKDVYYYAIDEATGQGTMRYMSLYRDYIYSKGARVISTGWDNNYMFMPSAETLHCQAAIIDKNIADRWHAIKGKLLSYAGPFAGPDNPDLMRRSHGMRMYRANYDGFLMLSYVSGMHIWNERVNGMYRNFLVAYPTVEGPVNSIAFEGLREGLDDIRYATLMRQLAEDCFASKDLQAIYAAKKAIAWFELTDPASVNLDLLRLEMADHIVQMMERLGRATK